MRFSLLLLVFYALPYSICGQLDITYSHLSASSNQSFDTGRITTNMGEPFIQTHYVPDYIFSLGILQPIILINTNVEGNLSAEIQVFPNPSNGLINCAVSGALKSLTVFDLMGNIVHYQPIIFSNSIDLTNLSAGKYYLCFQTSKRSNLFVPHIIL